MATAVLTFGAAQKAAGATLRLPCDFGNLPLLIQGYEIVSKTVTTTGTGAPTVSGVQLDYPYQVSALVAGGTAGNTYEITYTITLNDPDSSVFVCVGTLKIL